MTRSSARLIVVVSAAVVRPCLGLHDGRELLAPRSADAGGVPVRRRPRRPSPWPICRGGKSSTIRCCMRSIREAIDGQPRSAGRRRARGGSARAGGHRQVVPVSAGQLRANYGARRPSNASSTGTTTKTPRIRTAITVSSFSWEIDLFGRLRRQQRGRGGGGPGQRTGSARRDGHARRRCGLHLLPAARAGRAAHHRARQTLDLNDETVAYFQNRLQGGVSNRLELDRIQANRSQTAATIPSSSATSRLPRTRCRCCWDARPDRSCVNRFPSSRCRRPFLPDCRRRCSSGGRTWCGPSSSWWRPTPTSARPKRRSSRRSA